MTCSPVDTSTSISRGFGFSVMSFASAIRRLVSPDMAETTTTVVVSAVAMTLHPRGRSGSLDRADRRAAEFLHDECHVATRTPREYCAPALARAKKARDLTPFQRALKALGSPTASQFQCCGHAVRIRPPA